MPQKITEEDGLQAGWYDEAKEMTVERLAEFVESIATGYEHDYGTIIHAAAAAAIAGAQAVNHSEQGGITGFQASALMWEFVTHWWPSLQGRRLKLIDADTGEGAL